MRGSKHGGLIGRLMTGLAAAVLVVTGALTSGSTAAADIGTPAVPDEMTVSGYDYRTDLPARVNEGSAGNNLRFQYTAGEALSDGTFVLSLPKSAWRTSLRAGERLDPTSEHNGEVVVRPLARYEDLTDADCRSNDDQAIATTVINTAKAHLVVVKHVDCFPGQQISLRIFGIKAPAAVGRYRVPVSVSDVNGSRNLTSVVVKVSKRPTTRLVVDVATQVPYNQTTQVLVRALRPNGKLDTAYRGSFNLLTVLDPDCFFGFVPEARFETFDAADGGVKVVDVIFKRLGDNRLTIYDVGHQARGGRSGVYTVVGVATPQTCSVSYH